MKTLRPGPFRGDIAGVLPPAQGGTGEVTRAPLYVTAPWKKWATPEIFPNLAVLVVLGGSVGNISTFDDLPKPKVSQIDLFPNLAARSAGPVYTPPAMLDVQIKKRLTPQIDLYPNLSTGVIAAVYVPPSPIDPQFKRASIQVEMAPNIAVNLQTQVVKGTSEPVFSRKLLQVDLYPNIAIGTPQVTYVPPAAIDQQFKRNWGQLDLTPNLAALSPIAPTPLFQAIDPWVTKRYPPQVEVYQNQAIYVAVIAQQLPAPIEPRAYIKIPLTIDVLPNIAVNFTNIPPPPPVNTEVPAGRRQRTIYRITIDGQKFECRSYAEALALLERAKKAARQLIADRAAAAIEKQRDTARRVEVAKIEPPKIEVSSRDLRSAAAQTKREIKTIYEDEFKTAEIRMLMELSKRQSDDDESLILLM